MIEARGNARRLRTAASRHPSPCLASLGGRSSSSLSRCALQRDALLATVAVGRKSAARHKFPGLKPKKGKTPVKRTIETRSNSISVQGLPPGLATMLEGKDVKTFHYPTMLMLRMIRTQSRKGSRQSLSREKTAQLSTVQLELDCDYRPRPVLRCNSVPRQRRSVDHRSKPPVPQAISSPSPTESRLDSKSLSPPEQPPPAEKTRKTIFMRKEGCVCYSIPALLQGQG